ncbi:acetyl esterase [Rhizobiales bacterium GAS191]|nr:acetyl esterase [Rhizobiales bacterium GAS191]
MLRRNAEMELILERLRAAPAVDYRAMPITEARRLFDAAAAPWNQGAPEMETRQLEIPAHGQTMRARLYLPRKAAQLPLILFAHGGGWTFGSVDTHDATMRHLALASGCAVLGMDYRLAPEHPFPAPLDDVMAALDFAESGALGERVDATQLALAGDSAGANLALAALLRRRDAGKPPLRSAALFYGCYVPLFTTASHLSHGGGEFLLSTEMMRWYWRNFLGPDRDETQSLAAPYRADLAGLPPLYLAAAGFDPLLDDTVMLAEKLTRAAVDFRFDHVPCVVHGFLRMANELGVACRSIEAAGRFLAEHF